MDLLMRFPASPLLVSLLLVAACSSGRDSGARDSEPPARTAPAAESAAEDEAAAEAAPPPAPREISTDRANSADPGAGTPARRSSLQLVEEGKGYLIAGRPADAAVRLERATRVDPTNGFAYFHLGRARAAQGDRRGAIGMFEKAESLLGPYPDWRDAAARNRARLEGS